MIEYFVDVAKECINIGNFNSLMAMIGTFKSVTLSWLSLVRSNLQLSWLSLVCSNLCKCTMFMNVSVFGGRFQLDLFFKKSVN